MMLDDLKAVAYHEAGHVIAAHHFGMRIQSVQINPHDHTGQSILEDPTDWHDQAIQYYAGGRAEFMFAPERKGTSIGPIKDTMYAHNIIRRQFDPTGMADIDEIDRQVGKWDAKLAAKAAQLIAVKWSAVVALAEALYAAHRIDGDRAIVIIEKALAPE